MILYSFRKLVKQKVLNYFFLVKVVFITSFEKSKSKCIYIDIREIELNRYLLNFIKFFTIKGYSVYIPNDSSLIGKLFINKGELKYASLILKEKIKIGKPKKGTNVLWIKKEQLSNDFFNSDYYGNELFYHVPMSKYPLMYNPENINVVPNLTTIRKKSGFMAGNFDKDRYEDISKKKYFDIPNRREVIEYIYTQDYYKKLRNHKELIDFIEKDEDNFVFLIDRQDDFSLSLSELLKILEKFSFYIALPGVVMPQSHNLIEAIGSGCIPIIHETYAKLFIPSLVNQETAIIYKNINELNNIIAECFLMSEEEILVLRKNVINYYNLYLSPLSVVEKILNSSFEKIFIQAEHVSLSLLENKNNL
jgi:hypothetical protein